MSLSRQKLSSAFNRYYDPMPLCKLCKNAEANMKNAHLIPHFLIKTATNQDGSPLRDKELIFSMASNDFVDVYFGRDVSVEKIVEVRGKELTDEEIAAQSNSFTRDGLICRDCEGKIAVVESYIAEHLYNPLVAGQFNIVGEDAKGAKLSEWAKVAPGLYYLFVYSIFWRCSVARFDGFYLHPKIEEVLRGLLDANLDNNLNSMKAINATLIGQLPTISTFSEIPEGADPTGNFINVQRTRFPYFLIVNRMTFQLYEKERQLKGAQFHLNGLSNMLEKQVGVMNKNSVVKLSIINPGQGAELTKYTYQKLAEKYNRWQIGTVHELHKRIFGSKAPLPLLQLIFTKFHSGDIPLAERYSSDYFLNCLHFSFVHFGYLPIVDTGFQQAD